MILSRGRSYLFVHIPKTGGTALASALEARAMADDILVGDTPKAKRRRKRLSGVETAGRLWKHSTLADGLGLYGAGELDRLFVFTLVRNPWDRAVSYYHWLRGQSFDHPAVALARRTDFSGFLADPAQRVALAQHHYASYVTLPGGAERCDLFIRLERLEADIAPLEAHLGFRLAPLARVNESHRERDYRVYYSEADSEAIATICAPDIARFGYDFDDGPV